MDNINKKDGRDEEEKTYNYVKCGIVGYRNFNDYSLFKKEIKKIKKQYNYKFTHIISGGASGADSLAEKYASKKNIELIIHHADWNKFGKKAGPIRNEKIVNS